MMVPQIKTLFYLKFVYEFLVHSSDRPILGLEILRTVFKHSTCSENDNCIIGFPSILLQNYKKENMQTSFVLQKQIIMINNVSAHIYNYYQVKLGQYHIFSILDIDTSFRTLMLDITTWKVSISVGLRIILLESFPFFRLIPHSK